MSHAANELLTRLPSLRAAAAASKRADASTSATLADRIAAFAAKQAAEARATNSREFLARMSTLSKGMQQYAPEQLGYDGDWELGHRGI